MRDDLMHHMDLLAEQLCKHAGALLPILVAGDIAVVLCSPTIAGQGTAKRLGWNGAVSVFRMSDNGRKFLVGECSSIDSAKARWLTREPGAGQRSWKKGKRPGRIFVISGDRTLLVNYSPRKGFTIEPGTVDPASLS